MPNTQKSAEPKSGRLILSVGSELTIRETAMEIGKCVNCGVVVIPMSDGICPSCRKPFAIVSDMKVEIEHKAATAEALDETKINTTLKGRLQTGSYCSNCKKLYFKQQFVCQNCKGEVVPTSYFTTINFERITLILLIALIVGVVSLFQGQRLNNSLQTMLITAIVVTGMYFLSSYFFGTPFLSKTLYREKLRDYNGELITRTNLLDEIKETGCLFVVLLVIMVIILFLRSV